MFRKSALLPMLAMAVALGACDESPTAGSTDARLTVQLTDAPSDYLSSATVEIGRIEVLPASGGRLVVEEDGGTYDLLQLQNGVTADLGAIEVEPGMYTELRMVVERAELTLKEGYTFTDGSTTQEIQVPSGAQSGIKIGLSAADGAEGAGVEIRPGETVLVVDFDVSGNFVMQGDAETPAGIQGFLFTPALRAVVRDVAGSIAGTVAAPEGVTVEGLSVVATRVGAAEAETPAATLVKTDGTFQVNFVAPGTYSVTISNAPEGYTASAAEVTVDEDQDVADVELSISADTGS